MSESVNRAFMYGESVFTTMRMKSGEVVDWELHFDRLKKGVEFVYGPFRDEDWALTLRNRLETRCQSETGDRILRLTVYQEGSRGSLRGGSSTSGDLRIHLHSQSFESSRIPGSLTLRTVPALPKPSWWPSFLKAGNYLQTILAQKIFLESGDDDVLFVNSESEILASSVANIFVLKKGRVYTAPVGPQVLDGIMRKKVFAHAQGIFDDVVEEATSLEQLFRCDGIFGSNSVRGLFLIDRVDGRDTTLSADHRQRFEALRAKVCA